MARDWMPTTRDGILAMAKNWVNLIPAKPAWNIPQPLINELVNATGEADAALTQARSAERTTYITAECKAAFDKLEQDMRDLKRRCFFVPPLLDADLVSLGLPIHDGTPTPVPPPTGFAEADISWPGVGTIELHCRPVAGQPPLDLRSDYGYRIYYGVMPQGGASTEAATGVKRELMKVPTTGDELPHSRFVRRKKERLYFTGDSGKTVYFCIRYENSKGDAGPWGPIFSAIIP
jgi:hypothetical protein